ncbi:MAG TPA: hypothetical protein VM221_10670 [Armatimonadota bacterium]|nr:hypothetical protein [Armatimonadota bacterium]
MRKRGVIALGIVAAVAAITLGVDRPLAATGEGAAADVPALVAEGFGAASIGGEGGRVIWVTNLNDSGPGSFREAVSAEGPRIVKFKVGGIINLASNIEVEHGRLTIDGASAADKGGITLHGHSIELKGLECRDVIVRHLRVRRSGGDCINIGGGAHRVVIDHCSVSWATDEDFGINKGHYVTVQWCVIAEGLIEGGHEKGAHTDGMLVAHGANHVTVHHNFFASNGTRNALMHGEGGFGAGHEKTAIYMPIAIFDFRNNLIYNFTSGTELAQGLCANVVNNYYRYGPSDFPLVYPPSSGRGMPIHLQLETYYPGSERPKLYCKGNVGPNRPKDEGEEWALVYVGGVSQPGKWGSDPVYRSNKPFLTPPVKTQPAEEAAKLVLEEAGAFPRDDVDLRLVEEFRTGGGKIGAGYLEWKQKHNL